MWIFKLSARFALSPAFLSCLHHVVGGVLNEIYPGVYLFLISTVFESTQDVQAINQVEDHAWDRFRMSAVMCLALICTHGSLFVICACTLIQILAIATLRCKSHASTSL
jgi:hypothetical protein